MIIFDKQKWIKKIYNATCLQLIRDQTHYYRYSIIFFKYNYLKFALLINSALNVMTLNLLRHSYYY